MLDYQYTLETYKGMCSRYRCPECRRGKTFSRYMDAETGKHLADHVGRCNREINCGYHYTPRQYFEENGQSFKNELKPVRSLKTNPEVVPGPASLMPVEIFKKSLAGYDANHFVSYLISLFGDDIVRQLISRYFIGTSKFWPGATVFWQLDSKGKVRAGKIMLYKPDTGKRVKEPYSHISWAHKVLGMPDFELKQCLFGEHLLKDSSKPVAIVESEKTAIIASVYLPDFDWLAAGSLSSLNPERCKILDGRTVCLFPDLNAYEKWQKKAEELTRLMPGTIYHVDNLLESKASVEERKQGLDLADYLIRFNYKEFYCRGAESKKVINKSGVQNFRAPDPAASPVPEDLNAYEIFNRLEKKYPNLGILADHLELEIID